MRIVPVVALTALAVSVLSLPAAAEERSKSWNVLGPRGQSGVASHRVERDGAGNRAVQKTWKGDDGKTMESLTERSYDRDGKSGTLKRTYTGPNGETTTVDRKTQQNEDGSWTTTGGAAGADGRGYQLERNTVKNEDGTWTTKATYTGADGKTVTTSDTYAKTEDGYTHSGAYTGPDGKTLNTEGGLTKTEGGYQRAGTYAAGDGKTGTYGATGGRTENGFARTQTWTNPDGEERRRDISTTLNGDGTGSKTVTGVGGEDRTWTWQVNE